MVNNKRRFSDNDTNNGGQNKRVIVSDSDTGFKKNNDNKNWFNRDLKDRFNASNEKERINLFDLGDKRNKNPNPSTRFILNNNDSNFRAGNGNGGKFDYDMNISNNNRTIFAFEPSTTKRRIITEETTPKVTLKDNGGVSAIFKNLNDDGLANNNNMDRTQKRHIIISKQ